VKEQLVEGKKRVLVTSYPAKEESSSCYLVDGKRRGLSGVLARGTKEDDLLEPLLIAA